MADHSNTGDTNVISIYKEIGTGERIALSKLAVQHLEDTGRPLRIAIDISIWQFQVQSGQGGRNPALRTLYYRLLKLLSLSIQPLFVFDGPYRPSFKRGVKIAPFTACLDNFLTKQLLKCFGFPFHDAPGEAEAECALFQKEGVVDAVLSEDVDTLMFGCTLSLRNWTAEGNRGNKSPTHVDVHRSERTLATSGLDSEGMILVAMMRGGDYIQGGIPKCGVTIACQAARAGFGKDLYQLSKDDEAGLQDWRRRLNHELRTNEGGFFNRKCQTINIPDSFPDRKVFGYYTSPVVSSMEKLGRIRETIQWDAEVNITKLREFVAEAFNWTYLIGAKHFIRSLAPALLTNKLIRRSRLDCPDRESLDSKTIAEAKFVRTISGRRTDWVTDGEPELRIAYVPADIVGLDLDSEETDLIGFADSDENDENHLGSGGESRHRSRSPTRRQLTYDPTQVEKMWILETLLKFGVPLLVETWEEDMRDPKKFASRKAREKAALAKGSMQKGPMDQYVKTSKPGIENEIKSTNLPPDFLAPAIAVEPGSLRKMALQENRRGLGIAKSDQGEQHWKRKNAPLLGKPIGYPKDNEEIPWTIAKSTTTEHHSQLPPKSTSVDYSDPEPSFSVNQKDRVAGPGRNLGENITQRTFLRRSKHVRPGFASSGEKIPPKSAQADNIISTPKKVESTKPSPRKKRSPPQIFTKTCGLRQLKIPESIMKHKTQPIEEHTPDSRSPGRVNRRLDFTATPRYSSPVSDSDSLPSPSAIFSYPNSQSVSQQFEKSYKDEKLPLEKKATKSLVALRESLEGSWKHIEPWEVEKLPAARRVYSSVEVVDLTGS